MPTQVNSERILFTRGVPAVEALPNALLSECLQRVLSGPEAKTVLQYGNNSGYLPLKKLLGEQYGVGPEQIVVGNGSLHLQDLLAALLINPGDVVFVEQPSYDRAIRTFRRRGAKVIGIPLEHDGVDLAALEQALKRQVPAFMYIIPDFQNPAGVTTSAAKRQALVDLAVRYNFWLLEDIPYRTLRYTGKSLPALRDLNTDHVLTVSSYSKLISPAIRVGYLIGPEDLTRRLASLEEETILAPVLPTEAAVVEFHRSGYFDKNLASLKALYAPRLQAIITAIKTYLPNVPFAEPEGGFFVSVTLPKGAVKGNLLEEASKVGLVLTNGYDFFADPFSGNEDTKLGARFVRLPFCALTPDEINEGIRRLASLVH